MADIASKLNDLERWLSEGLITQENYEITKDRLTNEFMTETDPANIPKPKIEDFIGPEKGHTEEELLPDLQAYFYMLNKRKGLESGKDFTIQPPMFGTSDIDQPWKRHLDLTPRFNGNTGTMSTGVQDVSTSQPTSFSQPVKSSPVAGIPSYTYTPEGREGYSYGLVKGGSVPGYAKGGGKWLEGILSLFAGNTPKWLIDLVEKTKGGKKYVQNLMFPKKKLRDTPEGRDLIRLLTGKDPLIKAREVNEEKMKEALSKLEDSDKMATSMEEEVKRMMDQIEDLNQKIKLLSPDDDDPTYHAKGGIKFDKGLWQSLMSLGKSMGISPKEQLKTFIKIGIPIPDKLKQKWGITEADLEFKEPAEGLEWLILKDNPDLAKQPYSESKVNKMLSDEFEEIDKVPIQGDLFEKKSGGLISLIS